MDTDGEGTPDCNNACKDGVTKVLPGKCGNIPDMDTDGDFKLDCDDACAKDAKKTELVHGVADKDGVPECNDGCSEDSKKTGTVAGVCGCDTDT